MDVRAAVRNNADWCAAVCRAHGIGFTFGPRAWRGAGPTPPFYPEAITLTPGATAADVLPAAVAAGYSVKDSFAALDLFPYGFTSLFDAQWIHRPAAPAEGPEAERVTTAAQLRRWRAAWGDEHDIFRPALLDDPSVCLMAVAGGGFALNRTGTVAGLSNVFAADPGDLPAVWAAAVAAAGGLPIVGYERGDDLAHASAAGFRTLGPLRVWLRGSE
ncbi:hypothetical protein [Actinoplanes sp. URMC 104]|uniref:hypothetical protein n=1 Tax=Actinoplanes sp. URMC 104 TaxID=3423409 RepID=UPI003F1E05A0